MQKKKIGFTTTVLAATMSVYFSLSPMAVAAESIVLKNGMKGNSVIQLQNDLKKLGYFTEESTGYYGEVTAEAVKKLQAQYGQAQDGIAGGQTLALIEKLLGAAANDQSPATTLSVLKSGMKGNAVTKLQSNLKKLGYFTEEATGYYGEVTAEAVKKLQAQYRHTQDGIAGGQTLALIEKLLGEANNSAPAATPSALKLGMRGNNVTELQNDLKKLGYFTGETTGYYGGITAEAVKKLQARYRYAQDGVAGDNTLSLVKSLVKDKSAIAEALSSNAVLKKGMKGNAVTSLQSSLKKLGFLSAEPTGYYGDLTVEAVKKFQGRYGYTADGIAGSSTLSLVAKLIGQPQTVSSQAVATNAAKKEPVKQGEYMMPWFNEANNFFKIGKTATVYDIETGLSFKIKRTYGYNHADCETLTAQDTKTMKKIFGGDWSWERRAIVITVDGRKIAASMAGMPHAGIDKYAANRYISSRSGGYGRGANLDAVKSNDMNGVFDVHFYGSRTHSTNRVDSKHQTMVKKATEWAKKNY